MAETEASQYKGSVGDSKQHHLYRTSFISHASEILWAKEENRISEQEGEKNQILSSTSITAPLPESHCHMHITGDKYFWQSLLFI